jgi:cytochrome c556
MGNVRRGFSGALAVTFVLASTTSLAADPRPEDFVKFRRAVFTVLGWKFQQMVSVSKGEKPFVKDEFLRNAVLVEQLSKLPLDGFRPGTDKGETRAKAELWTNMDDFKAKAETLASEAGKLVDVARAGNLKDIKVQLGKTGASCKACHDEYVQK